MPEDVPEHLRSALSRFEDSVGRFKTALMRVQLPEPPPMPTPTPQEFADAAARPDAAPQLRDVARAVAEGRASWEEIAVGRGSAPEVRELRVEGAHLAFEAREQQEAADAAAAQPPPPPATPTFRRTVRNDDDFENESNLY